MPKLTMNEIARRLTLREGKKHSLGIGDVKEVLRCLRDEWRANPNDVIAVLGKYFGLASKRGDGTLYFPRRRKK
jgi:hypothetical protein